MHINKKQISLWIRKRKAFKTNQQRAEKTLASKIIGKAKRAEACKSPRIMFVKSPNHMSILLIQVRTKKSSDAYREPFQLFSSKRPSELVLFQCLLDSSLDLNDNREFNTQKRLYDLSLLYQ